MSPSAPSHELDLALPSVVLGSTIADRYQVLELIGEGGMARVYEVEHRELGRRFALKLLRPDLARDGKQVERFQHEARAVAKLESIHIVGMVDYGVTANGAPFFVMERLRGSDLRGLIVREAPLPATRTVHIGLDACRGLAVAHGAGIIHRDLKPENLFITRDAQGRDLCKLLDFGVAKLTEQNPTLPGALVGTARYMAPEQIDGAHPIGPGTDLFALGVTLFECLTGRPPFDADTFERVLFKIMNEPTPPLLELRPNLEPELAALVTRMLAKNPAQRPQSALALAAELALFLPQERGLRDPTPSVTLEMARGVAALPQDNTPRELRPFSRSPRLVAALAGAVGLTLCAALGLLWATSRRPPATSVTNATAQPPAELRPLAPPRLPPSASGSAAPEATPLRSAPSAAPKVAPALPALPLFYPRRPKPRQP